MSDTIMFTGYCNHCGKDAVIVVFPDGRRDLPCGWEYRLIQDPVHGTELVRSWYATLCPECAKNEQEGDER